MFDVGALAAAGLNSGARLGPVWTGSIELGWVEQLAMCHGVLYVELAGTWRPDGAEGAGMPNAGMPS